MLNQSTKLKRISPECLQPISVANELEIKPINVPLLVFGYMLQDCHETHLEISTSIRQVGFIAGCTIAKQNRGNSLRFWSINWPETMMTWKWTENLPVIYTQYRAKHRIYFSHLSEETRMKHTLLCLFYDFLIWF